PFRLRGKTIGVFNVYATETGFFGQQEEITLLEEIGSDISFALDTLETETARQQAEARRHQSEQKFSTIFEKGAFAAALSSLPDGTLVDVNEAFEKAFGFTRQEAIGKTSLELGINPDDEGRARILAAMKEYGSARHQEVTLH